MHIDCDRILLCISGAACGPLITGWVSDEFVSLFVRNKSMHIHVLTSCEKFRSSYRRVHVLGTQVSCILRV